MPSKEEIIREGILALNFRDIDERTFLSEMSVDHLLKYLQSQGVVIKVDRELVVPEGCSITATLLLMLKEAGYVAVEPLIKEVPNG